MKVYQKIHTLVASIKRCEMNDRQEWLARYRSDLSTLLKERLPSGGGFDNGSDLLLCDDKKMIFQTAFHRMDDNGFYSGWSYFKITVVPSFDGIDIKVTTRDDRSLIDFVFESFYISLTENI